MSNLFFAQFPIQNIPIKSRNVAASERFVQGKKCKWQKMIDESDKIKFIYI